MAAETPCGPLYVRLSASEGIPGPRVVWGDERPSGARSGGWVDGEPTVDAPPRGSTAPLSAPQRPEVARDPQAPQRAADERTAPPHIPGQTELPLHPYQPTLWSL